MPYKASKAEQPDMPSTTTSVGTKVTTNAPTKQEAPGPVNPDSLAAESQAFREANSVEIGSSNNQQQSRPQEGADARAPGTSSNKKKKKKKSSSETKHVDKAPTYVQTLYYRDPKGPHGKNIKEDDSIGTEDQSKNLSFTADIGTKDDPGLLAERRFALGNSAPARSTAPRQKEIEDDIGMYEGLDEEEA